MGRAMRGMRAMVLDRFFLMMIRMLMVVMMTMGRVMRGERMMVSDRFLLPILTHQYKQTHHNS